MPGHAPREWLLPEPACAATFHQKGGRYCSRPRLSVLVSAPTPTLGGFSYSSWPWGGSAGILTILLGAPHPTRSGMESPGLSGDAGVAQSLFHVVLGPHLSLWPRHAASPEDGCPPWPLRAPNGTQEEPPGFFDTGAGNPQNVTVCPICSFSGHRPADGLRRGTTQGLEGQQAWPRGASFGGWPPRPDFTYKKTEALRVE